MNTSIYQQRRHYNKLAHTLGFVFLRSCQLSPRKFEVTYSVNEFGIEMRYYFYFNDDSVTYRPVNGGVKHWTLSIL